MITSINNHQLKPDPISLAHSAKVQAEICQVLTQHHGKIGFDHFMELALYAPGLGYYTAGARKFGAAGDFVTAPELSSIFSKCLAQQCAQVLSHLEQGIILEFGAGSGIMAADVLQHLAELDQLPHQYWILEVSPELRQRQQQTLIQACPQLLERVGWLTQLPATKFDGVILANEVIDAMPAHRFKLDQSASPKLQEYFVALQGEEFCWQLEPARMNVAAKLQPIIKNYLHHTDNYTSEINLHIEPWLNSLSDILNCGVVLLIDYGFPRHEFYHPERVMGTLMCHFRHHSHDNPLIWPGIQDITTHVDFTAIAEFGTKAGFDLLGYTNQAAFLINCGLDRFAQAPNEVEQININNEIKRLTLPTEMGELFKVIALARKFENELIGFQQMNRIHQL